jgi:glycerol-3-phosphate acyltransferase PlsX
VTVAVDAGGADDLDGVATAVAGLAADGHRLLVFGPADRMGAARAPGVELVDAPVSIAKDPDPVRAVRAHPESSIVQAARAVADGRADALVAGGTTGAALAAGLFHVKRARGIYRPALAVPVPVPGRAPVTLVDVGANDVVRPEHLVQFAFMGAALARTVLGIARPRVALLANGTEPGKGRDEVVAAHARLAGATSELFAFAGNVEGFDVLTGGADVVVTDGFTGNVALKVVEGTSRAMIDLVRRAATSSARAKAGGLLLRPALRALRDEIDPEAVGGAYLLGLRRLVVVPHGSFGAGGWRSAVLAARDGVREDLAGRTHGALEAAGALRRAGASEAAASV